MSAATLFAQPYQQVIDNRAMTETPGVPLVGAKIYVYVTGTTTPQAVYHDSDLNTAWTQPIVTNAAGITDDPIFVDTTPSLKVLITDADDVDLPGYPMDPWSPYALAT
jgi:hypothetical protein